MQNHTFHMFYVKHKKPHSKYNLSTLIFVYYPLELLNSTQVWNLGGQIPWKQVGCILALE